MAKILYFSSIASHRKSYTRTKALAEAGHEVELAAFSREGFRSPNAEEVTYFDLGWSRNGGRLRRLAHLPRYIFRSIRFARTARSADIIWANTIEMLALARIARLFLAGPRRMVYDVADLTNAQVPRRRLTSPVRTFERFLCRPLTALVTTSPWFYWEYYRSVIPRATSSYLLENKVSAPIQERAAPEPRGPWRICWHGLLRCPETLNALLGLAEALPDQVEVHVWGWTETLEAGLRRASELAPNFYRHGTYNEDEIGRVFDGTHFICALDLSDGTNSTLLLPNRLYHSAAYRIPCLAAKGTACGTVVEATSCGVTVGPRYTEDLIQLFREMTPDRYRKLCEAPSPHLASRAVYSHEVEHIARSVLNGERAAISWEPDASVVLGNRQ